MNDKISAVGNRKWACFCPKYSLQVHSVGSSVTTTAHMPESQGFQHLIYLRHLQSSLRHRLSAVKHAHDSLTVLDLQSQDEASVRSRSQGHKSHTSGPHSSHLLTFPTPAATSAKLRNPSRWWSTDPIRPTNLAKTGFP
jgi:hypothetical protein